MLSVDHPAINKFYRNINMNSKRNSKDESIYDFFQKEVKGLPELVLLPYALKGDLGLQKQVKASFWLGLNSTVHNIVRCGNGHVQASSKRNHPQRLEATKHSSQRQLRTIDH